MSDSKTRYLGYALLATILVGITLVLVPFFGSLKPSAQADAVYSQGQFSASELDDLVPGEVRLVKTGLGPFYVVVPTEEMMSDLEQAEGQSAYRVYDTYDEQLGAFALWPVSPKRKGPPCAVRHMDKDPDGKGLVKFGGFFDPCSGAQFDYAGRVSISTHNNNVANLKRPAFERISGDTYQLTNLDDLMRHWP